MTLRLIIGLPNSGKSSYAERFHNVIHYDDYLGQPEEVRQAAYKAAGGDVTIEGIYNTVAARKTVLDAVNADRRVCIWLDTPPEECSRRENRGRSQLLMRLHQKIFEPPTPDEGWDEIIVVTPEET